MFFYLENSRVLKCLSYADVPLCLHEQVSVWSCADYSKAQMTQTMEESHHATYSPAKWDYINSLQ